MILESRPFVQNLFNVIKERSYLPAPAVSGTTALSHQSHVEGSMSIAVSEKKDVDERKETVHKVRDDGKKVLTHVDKIKEHSKVNTFSDFIYSYDTTFTGHFSWGIYGIFWRSQRSPSGFPRTHIMVTA